ncbi:ribosome silencing factor [Geoalkalibacter halelectricus]|uniref:Ribosomal silencing factor RsfS n=1 Tax=Geoalkalibacter halelectricus TaxID=2847045 RepID=A0ABY5ZQD0_9BACT|nr:ribosome silencing factor [Geoalkalibacter halelectricus]MDO3378592.1 ribosome silencing factor [Geoalkalibacter halelectricus]UWZ80095.1 ribosome silencing factor [Geoalkalibacter halelectricus]
MQSDQRALLCAAHALEKKATDVRLLDVRKLSSLTDFLLLVTGRSDRQVQAIAEGVRLGLKNQHHTLPLAIEGMNEGRWVLLDYGDVMVHVFQPAVREFYDLDGLWREAAELPIPDEYHWENKAAAR